jgi:hypothetical protein
MIPGFRRDASWFNVHWRVEMGRSPLDGKQWHAVPPAKVLCGGVFNEQSEKATFPKALIRRTLPAM